MMQQCSTPSSRTLRRAPAPEPACSRHQLRTSPQLQDRGPPCLRGTNPPPRSDPSCHPATRRGPIVVPVARDRRQNSIGMLNVPASFAVLATTRRASVVSAVADIHIFGVAIASSRQTPSNGTQMRRHLPATDAACAVPQQYSPKPTVTSQT